MTVSFSELRAKEVIRLCDAACIGCICDLLLDTERGCICAVYVMSVRGWGAVFSGERMVIPWEKIRCVGRDTVLADLSDEDCRRCRVDDGRRRHRWFSRKS